MSKTTVTLTGNISVDFTLVARNLPECEAEIQKLEAAIADTENFSKLSAKHQVMSKLIVEAYRKDGIEGGIRELFRFNLRECMNDMFRGELAMNTDVATVKVAPCRVKLETAEKVLNGAKVRKAFAKADAELNTKYEA